MSGGDLIKWGVIGLVGLWVYETFLATPAAAATATAALPAGSAPSPTAVTPAPVVPPATASSGGLDALYNALLAKAQGGDGVTSSGGVLSANGDVWNYFLSQVNPSVNTSALDPTVILVNLITGPGSPPNRATPVTSSQYWAAAGPIVGKQLGLSGVRLGLAGLGAAIIGGSNQLRRRRA